MGDKLSPIFIFPIFARMKQEIYKISFKRYNSTKFKDHSSISLKNNFISTDSNFDIIEVPTQKHPFFKMESSSNTEECFVENFSNQLFHRHFLNMTKLKYQNHLFLRYYSHFEVNLPLWRLFYLKFWLTLGFFLLFFDVLVFCLLSLLPLLFKSVS